MDARTYLRKFRLRPGDQTWDMIVPEELLDLAGWYRVCGDLPSMFGCVYLYTALRHPPPSDCPRTVELGREVLDAWLVARANPAPR